jgi:hypothetical protein
MNTLNIAVKSFACGVAALAISTVLSWSLVDSTATVPFASHPAQVNKVAEATARPHYLVHVAARAAERA